jgi:predicted enzyme related to lactoylglutathione lyase
MSRVIHFEIPADHPERTMAFYKNVFNWEIKKWDGPEDYWLVKTGEETEPGINGGIMRRYEPLNMKGISGFVCTIQVDDIEKFLEKVTINSGTIMSPKMDIPGVGWLAYCKDTEGNTFGLMESKEK